MVDLDCNSEQQQNWIAAVDQKCQEDNVDMEEKWREQLKDKSCVCLNCGRDYHARIGDWATPDVANKNDWNR